METVTLADLFYQFQPIAMISKSKIKLVKSLALKKHRQKEHLFIVEGDKNVAEVLNSGFRVKELFATETFLKNNAPTTEKAEKITEARREELKKASLLQTPQHSLAICELPPAGELPRQLEGWSFYLDGIQDPGNLGTIVRTCDWFGIDRLFCSPETVDIFNPKVIQASMGSFSRVNVSYLPFKKLAGIASASGVKIVGTFSDGQSIYSTPLPGKAIIVLGNEGKGISREVENSIDFRLGIPGAHALSSGPESLNVAVTAGIICSEFYRKNG